MSSNSLELKLSVDLRHAEMYRRICDALLELEQLIASSIGVYGIGESDSDLEPEDDLKVWGDVLEEWCPTYCDIVRELDRDDDE